MENRVKIFETIGELRRLVVWDGEMVIDDKNRIIDVIDELQETLAYVK